jgi:hypothetical protein
MNKKANSNFNFAENARMKEILKYTVFKKGSPVEQVEDCNLIVNGAHRY